MPEFVVVNFDGKLLSAWDAQKSKEESLAVFIWYINKERLIAVSRLEKSSGR